MSKPCAGLQVLVVEDDPDFAAFMVSALCRSGCSTRVAPDGATALACVKACPPDLITLDLRMPGKSGAFFFRELRSTAAFSDIPVIVVTGLTSRDADPRPIVHARLQVGSLRGPEAYLEKPLGADTLVRTILDLLAAPTPSSAVAGGR